MEVLDQEAVERDHARRTAKQKKWAFWAVFVHDPALPRGTWTVDGVEQAEELTEASLKVAVNREGKKPVVAVAAPLHLTMAEIMGFHPPYAASSVDEPAQPERC